MSSLTARNFPPGLKQSDEPQERAPRGRPAGAGPGAFDKPMSFRPGQLPAGS